KNFYFSIQYSTELSNVKYIVEYNYSFEWLKDHSKGAKILTEELKVKESGNNKFKSYLKRNNNKAEYLSSLKGRCNNELNVENNELAINKIANFDSLFYLELIKELNKIEFSFIKMLNTDEAFNSALITKDVTSEGVELDLDNGLNICEAIFNLKEKEPEKYELLVNSFKTLIPSIESVSAHEINLKEQFGENLINKEEIPFEIPEKIYDIRIKEKQNNQLTTIQNISDGSKRIFLLLTSAILADIKNIPLIFFEELENSIHPYLFQRLLIILDEILQESKLVITSHSPYLLQYIDLKNIYIGVPSTNGVATFQRFKSSSINTVVSNAEEEELNIGDYIFSLLIDDFSGLDNEINDYLEHKLDE
ncbi:AAA family ATPase, partial [Bacillus altitudinis]|uniref:AAA family ATPase n=2 Tax=Bacillaceae TaxID=186817 RepID=UPI0005D3F6EB